MEDVAGSGNNGLIYGATWSEDVPNGCNDPLAENYDEGTIFNDGSCEYPDNGDYLLSFNGQDNYVVGSALHHWTPLLQMKLQFQPGLM